MNFLNLRANLYLLNTHKDCNYLLFVKTYFKFKN